MSERPILFSAPMVRAILAGTKSQTRRIIKPQPPEWSSGIGCYTTDGHPEQTEFVLKDEDGDPADAPRIRCPFSVGQRLWVRETWWVDKTVPEEDRAVVYRASEPDWPVKWRPSIFMPRDYSRIDLEVTERRAQRVQVITEEDATAEGIEAYYPQDAPEKLHALWDSINGKRAPWASNPWCWCLTFRRVRP